jgi:hypothetical protein
MVNTKKISKNTKKPKETKSSRSFVIGAGNFISQILFFWVFIFVFVLRRSKDLSGLYLVLRENDTASLNDELLEKKWEEEKQLAVKKNR